MHLAPLTKIMYASDGHSRPEMIAIAALMTRPHLKSALASSGHLTAAETSFYTRLILGDTAARVYGLQDKYSSLSSEQDVGEDVLVGYGGDRDLVQEIDHLRLCWVDTSNILRCRVLHGSVVRKRGLDGLNVCLTNAVMSLPCMYDLALESAVGEVQFVPGSLYLSNFFFVLIFFLLDILWCL
jgi:hypothetical protein